MKKTLLSITTLGAAAVIASSVGMKNSPAYAAAKPTLEYTAQQTKVCAPVVLTDAATDAKKSIRGESVTATAVAKVSAAEGYFIDPREGAYAFVNTGGTHMNRRGEPKVTERLNGFLPLQMSITNAAHRGTSLRTGRNAVAVAGIAAFQVKATPECMAALGLFGEQTTVTVN